MFFVKHGAGNRRAQVELVFLAKFDHAPNSFLPGLQIRLGRTRQRLMLDDFLDKLLQLHTSRVRLYEKASFYVGSECQRNRHRIPLCSGSSLAEHTKFPANRKMVQIDRVYSRYGASCPGGAYRSRRPGE